MVIPIRQLIDGVRRERAVRLPASASDSQLALVRHQQETVAMMKAREANHIPWNMGIRDIPGRYSPPGDAHGCATDLWVSAGLPVRRFPVRTWSR
eukprot:11175649-Lingulodinium_polyedra.AAC.1